MRASTQTGTHVRRSFLVKKRKKSCRLKTRTQLEKQRVRTAKVSLLAIAFFVGAVVLTSFIEDIPSESSLPTFAQILTESELVAESGPQEISSVSVNDPLQIEQAGISLKMQNDEGTILWYESIWNMEQSKTHVRSALTAAGWEQTSSVTDQIHSFSRPSTSGVSEKSIFVSFYASNKGCSVLVEIL